VEDVRVRTDSGPVSDSDYTDATGIYTLTVISGTYAIEVSKSGYFPPPEQTVTVPPSQTGVDFVFTTVTPADPLQLYLHIGDCLWPKRPQAGNSYYVNCVGSCTFSWRAVLGGDIPGNMSDTVYTLRLDSIYGNFNAALTLSRQGEDEISLADWSGTGRGRYEKQTVGTEMITSIGDVLTLTLDLPNGGNVTVYESSCDFFGCSISTSYLIIESESPLNQSPYTPSNPNPDIGTTDVPITQILSWQGGDPDGDPVTYTVAFGISDPPPFATTTVLTSYTPTLVTNSTYYWVITATDSISMSVGPVWHFTTGPSTGEYPIYLPLVVRNY
jgi:hypothetical protein